MGAHPARDPVDRRRVEGMDVPRAGGQRGAARQLQHVDLELRRGDGDRVGSWCGGAEVGAESRRTRHPGAQLDQHQIGFRPFDAAYPQRGRLGSESVDDPLGEGASEVHAAIWSVRRHGVTCPGALSSAGMIGSAYRVGSTGQTQHATPSMTLACRGW